MTRYDVLDFIRRNPGCTISEVAKGLGIYRSMAEAHVRHLRLDGLLDRVEASTKNSWGRPVKTFRYFINPEGESKLVRGR